jgi:hypothetical protein
VVGAKISGRNSTYLGGYDDNDGTLSTTDRSRSTRDGLRMPDYGGHSRRAKDRRNSNRRTVRRQRDKYGHMLAAGNNNVVVKRMFHMCN